MARLTVYLRTEQLPPPGGLVLAVPRGMTGIRPGHWRPTRVTEENRPWLLRAFHATSLADPDPDPGRDAAAAAVVPAWEDVRARVEARGD